MLAALAAGQRDPTVLAELARGRMRGKRGALVQALHGRFDDHHAELRGCIIFRRGVETSAFRRGGNAAPPLTR
jgi:hypothetical protein